MSIGDDVRAAMSEAGGRPEAGVPQGQPQAGVPEGEGNGGAPIETSESAGRARDASGRFAKGGDKTEEKSTSVPPKSEAAPAAPATPTKRGAPQSFRPTVRDFWDKVPPEVQEEIYRVQGTTQKLLQQYAGQRKQAEAWERMIAPYKPHIQGDPAQWTEGILSRAIQLQTGTKQQRAHIAAQILMESGADLDLVNAALAGGAQQPQYQQETRAEDPLKGEIEALKQQLHSLQYAPVVDAFVREAEFLDEPMPDGRHTVRDMVALQLRVAGEQGVELSLKDAYSMVVAQHPTIQEALRQRSEAKSQAERAASTARAQAASSSVRTEPVVAPPPESAGGSVADDIRATYAMLRKRG